MCLIGLFSGWFGFTGSCRRGSGVRPGSWRHRAGLPLVGAFCFNTNVPVAFRCFVLVCEGKTRTRSCAEASWTRGFYGCGHVSHVRSHREPGCGDSDCIHARTRGTACPQTVRARLPAGECPRSCLWSPCRPATGPDPTSAVTPFANMLLFIVSFQNSLLLGDARSCASQRQCSDHRPRARPAAVVALHPLLVGLHS